MKELIKIYFFDKNINFLYLYTFFNSLIFAYVIERLFGLSRNISIQEMVYIEIIYAVVTLILEVPTGLVSDIFGKKKALVISSIFIFFEFFILIFANNFFTFILSSLSAAIGNTLASGTVNALFYDSLKERNKEKEFEKVLGIKNLFDSLPAIIGGLIGAYIAEKVGYSILYILSSISILFSFIITCFIKEPKLQSNLDNESVNFKLEDVKNFFISNNSIKFIVLYVSVFHSVVCYIDEYWQIYFSEISIPIALFGIYSLLRETFNSISSLLTYKLKILIGEKSILSLCLIISTISILISSYTHSWIGFIPLSIIFICLGSLEITTISFLHHKASSEFRATAESIMSLGIRVFSILVGLIFGYISTNYSIFSGFNILGIILGVYTVYYLIYQFKYLNNDE